MVNCEGSTVCSVMLVARAFMLTIETVEQVSLLFSRMKNVVFPFFMHNLQNTWGLNQNSNHLTDQV